MVRVLLVESIKVLPHQSLKVADRQYPDEATLLVEPFIDAAVQVEEALVNASSNCLARVVVNNASGVSCQVEKGVCLGSAIEVALVEPSEPGPIVNRVRDEPVGGIAADEPRKRKLLGMVKKSSRSRRVSSIAGFHDVFSLEEGERGETDLTDMVIDTGDSPPRRVPARRMPLAVRREVSKQLKNMQQAGVIQPSASPWSSPVVMVKKKDGTQHFCVDYRTLNAVTKSDTFPLPRIDDLLDQLGDSRYFSTLDLASGFWQIRLSDSAVEKTAFSVPQGLFEFRVMPFGLTNAPAVLQRLMERGLNPEDGPDFVKVYIDDVLVFSHNLEDHLEHLRLVLLRIREAGLKLKPSKCCFVTTNIEYLGHVLTPEGLKPARL